ncbi:ferrochelatase [Spartinivicinus poritis]|uniref:Ferrochelatase n=1 Tax=Spartinivicinus poritis TaxID=2994640 RepID=A0ABT5U9K8_9GAMM|nr:ferrochelatase [Spartinivicinus sp. A2-2]MDE1463042.1 ferrochelatase [Spartinivicinus sp. A2-2]
MKSQAVLLVNLGSPDSPKEKDVRQYLKQFLMDPYVVDVPGWLRWLIVNCLVLPSRPKQSAEAYQSIWWPEGSPLVVLTQRLTDKLAKEVDYPVHFAMRYGQPAMEKEILQLAKTGIDELLLVPLYPHYAMSTVKTCIEEARRVLAKHHLSLKIRLHPVFFGHEQYISVLDEVTKPYIEEPFDHLLFSYHGLPERHLRKDDPTGSHCLSSAECCQQPHQAHQTCYRAQVYKTAELLANKLGLKEAQYSVAFQSRLGRDKWLTPYTSERLVELAQQGVKRLLVICPSFVADCLETLEEIGIQGKEAFIEAGGELLTLVPCLNDDAKWVSVLTDWLKQSWDNYPQLDKV